MTTTIPDRTEHRPTVTTSWAAALAATMTRCASWRVWLLSTAAFAVFAGVFFASSAPFAIPRVAVACGQAPLDVRFTSTAADVNSFLDACGAAGRAAYRAMQLADLLYPLVFALFLATSLAVVLNRLAPRHPGVLALAALPFLGSALDYLENSFAWLALAAYPDPSATASLLGLASAAKTSVFWIAGTVLLASSAVLALGEARRRLGRAPVGVGASAPNAEDS